MEGSKSQFASIKILKWYRKKRSPLPNVMLLSSNEHVHTEVQAIFYFLT